MRATMHINVSAIMVAMGLLFLAGSLFGRVFLNEPVFLFAALPATLLIFGPLMNESGEDKKRADERDLVMVDEKPDENREEKAFSIRNHYGLTEREEEIMGLLARGLSRNAIGEKLYLSRNTVDTHIRSLYLKLGCHKKDELVRLLEQETRKSSCY